MSSGITREGRHVHFFNVHLIDLRHVLNERKNMAVKSVKVLTPLEVIPLLKVTILVSINDLQGNKWFELKFDVSSNLQVICISLSNIQKL